MIDTPLIVDQHLHQLHSAGSIGRHQGFAQTPRGKGDPALVANRLSDLEALLITHDSLLRVAQAVVGIAQIAEGDSLTMAVAYSPQYCQAFLKVANRLAEIAQFGIGGPQVTQHPP